MLRASPSLSTNERELGLGVRGSVPSRLCGPPHFNRRTKFDAMKYVLYYQSSPDVMTLAPLHAEAHRAHWQQFLSSGTLLMIGPFADPRDGAMGIFTTREAAESFAAGDPFVLNGVVSNWVIRNWNEAVVLAINP